MNTKDYRIKGAVLYQLIIDKINSAAIINERVLDIGCGDMTLLENIKGKEKIGIDIDDKHIERSTKKYKKATYKKMSLAKTTFPSNYFDLAFCINVFHHIDLKKGLPEIKRILKKEGNFMCVVMNKSFPFTADPKALRNKILRKPIRFSWQAGDYSPIMYNKNQLKPIFSRFGFEVIEITPFDSYFSNLFDVFSTVLLRITPNSFTPILFRYFARFSYLLFLLEAKIFNFNNSRSLFIHAAKKA
jgi:ubiquinone/menaquinone biosynthesis C-methylase UbiE